MYSLKVNTLMQIQNIYMQIFSPDFFSKQIVTIDICTTILNIFPIVVPETHETASNSFTLINLAGKTIIT